MSGPHFSIVLTAFERPEALRRAISRVLEQTYRSFELVVVDDGSRPPLDWVTAEWPEEERLRYLRLENGGPGRARSEGARRTIGKWLCFLDDDDYYLEDHLETLARQCTDDRRTLVRTGVWRERKGVRRREALYTNGPGILQQYWAAPVSLLSVAIPRAAYVAVSPPVTSAIEDAEWLVELVLRFGMHQSADYTTVYTEHDSNRTNTMVREGDLRQRIAVVERLSRLPGLTEAVGAGAIADRMEHHRHHWMRQAIRAGRLAAAARVGATSLWAGGKGSLRQWGMTLRTLTGVLLGRGTLYRRLVREASYRVGRRFTRLLLPLYRRLLRRKSFRSEDACFIAATPRSGSTWLMEMLQQVVPCAPVYEPLHIDRAAVPAVGWGILPVIRAEEPDAGVVRYVEGVLRYTSPNEWTAQYLSLRQLLAAEVVLVKCVRGNMALEYMLNCFQLKRPPVVLIRHPLATVVSMLQTFRTRPLPFADLYAARPEQYERFAAHLPYLQGLTTDLERWVAYWCMDNQDVLNKPALVERSIRVYYEHLLTDPERELRRILDAWEVNTASLPSLKTDRASSSDHRNDLAADTDQQLRKAWQRTTVGERDRVQAVLDYFGIRVYRVDDPYPVEINSVPRSLPD